jgi:MarR-like DNA-binding transcriptional regulator SgrR of sgrS sRNA
MTISADGSRVQADTPRLAEDRLVLELRRREPTPGAPVRVLLAELAESLSVSERTVRRARRSLESRGMLHVTPGRRHQPSAYQVCA